MKDMKARLMNMPDWVGNAIVGICTALVGFAFAWGSLKSEVSAQVTAQSTDASDIKQLIVSQAGLVVTVNALAKNQERLDTDFVQLKNLLMDANGRHRYDPTTLGSARP